MATSPSHGGSARLSRLKTLLAKSPPNIIGLLSHERPYLTPSERVSILNWLLARPHLWRRVTAPQRPTFHTLHEFPTLKPIGAAGELTWVARALSHDHTALASFVALSNDYVVAVSQNSYERAAEILDDIEKSFGISIWGIKRRIYLAQIASGLDAQKQYAESLWKNNSGSAVTKIIAYLVSARNEPSITPAGFSEWCNGYLAGIHWPEYLLRYVKFHALPPLLTTLSSAEVNDVLQVEFSGNCIDAYEAVVVLAPQVLISGNDVEQDAVITSVLPLLRLTNDSRGSLMQLMLGSGNDASPTEDPASFLIDDLLRNCSTETRDAAIKLLDAAPQNADLWVATAMATASVGHERAITQSLSSRTAVSAGKLLSSASSSHDEFADLHKTALNLFGTPLSACIAGLLADMSRAEALPDFTNAGHIAALWSNAGTILWSGAVPDPQELCGAALAVAPQQGSLARSASAFLCGGQEPPAALSAEIRRYLVALRALLLGRIDEALQVGVETLVEDKGVYRRRAQRVVADALLKSGRTQEVTQFIAGEYIRDSTSHDMLPIRRTCEALKAAHPITFAEDINVPIAFDVHSRVIDRTFDSERAFAYSDFMRANAENCPSRLSAAKIGDKERFVYFLRYVATESVMARSRAFKSSRAVLEERLSICRILLEIDPQNAEAHQTEMRNLLRRLMLQKRLRQIEQHKIYVDLESFRRAADLRFREMFLRYQDLRRLHHDEYSVQDPEVLSALRKAHAGDSDQLFQLRLPANPANELLTQLVAGLREEYISSPDHGLDKYLSVRIRHGTFAAQLRAPLDAANLITTREGGTGKYSRNAYWLERLKLSTEDSVRVDRRLAAFSAEFDTWIADWLSTLQVATESGTDKVFEFPLTEPTLRLLAEYITPETTFDQFVDYIVSQLFEVTLDRDLLKAREHILRNIRPAASNMLQHLLDDLTRILLQRLANEFVDAVRAADTELQKALSRIEAWFHRTESIVEEPFSVSDAVMIGAEMVRSVSPQLRVEGPGLEAETISLPGWLLNSLVDVFSLMFHNVIRHSGLPNPVAVVSTTFPDPSTLSIAVTNEVEPTVVSEENRARVARIRSDMESPEHLKFVSREGGTGFHKLKKILTHDLNPNAILEFGFVDDCSFAVRFQANLKVL